MFNKILEELDRTELWQPYSDEIAVAEHKHILSNLALVCHFFCTVLLPQIFKSLKFSGLPHKESDTPGYMSFCRALIRGRSQLICWCFMSESVPLVNGILMTNGYSMGFFGAL